MRPKKIGQSGKVGGFWKVWSFHQAGRTASFLNRWRFCCCLLGWAAACWCRFAWRLSVFAELVLLGRQLTWIVDFLMSELLLCYWYELLKLLKRAQVSVLFGTEMRTLALRCPELVNFYIFYMNSFLSIPLCTSFLEFAQRFSGWFETGRFVFFLTFLLKLSFVICFNVHLEGSNLTQSCRKRESILLYEWDICRSLSFLPLF